MTTKNFQKKYLIIVTAIIILIGIITMSNKLSNHNMVYAIELSDVESHWAQSDIEFMQSKGAIEGYSDRTFRPDNNVTTGEAIKLIVANFDKTITNGIEHWASNYLKYATEKGIVKYNQYYNSDLNANITRKEVMYMIINSLDNLAYKPIIDDSKIKIEFNDVDINVNENGIDFYNAIKKCYLLGIVIGDENNNINPNDKITRAELVTILTRAYNEGRRQYNLEYKVYNNPSNKGIYGPVLNIMPNSFYEKFSEYKQNESPYNYANQKFYDFSQEAIKTSKTKLETAISALINVSYEFTDAEWSEWKASIMNFCDVSLNDIYDEKKNKSKVDEYIQYIKENKIIIKGGVIMDPTTLGEIKYSKGKYSFAIKGMINVEFLSNPNNVKRITYNDFINEKVTIYNKQDCNYILVNINEEDYKGILNYIKFRLDSIIYIEEE